jgi:hypothetical protein
MKSWLAVLFVVGILVSLAVGQAAQPATAPKYDVTTEGKFKGTVGDIYDRSCPVSGGIGFHFVLKQENAEPIEVHVVLRKTMKEYELQLNKGDQVEVIGSKLKLDGVDTIYAREISLGDQTFIFRDKQGKLVW